MTRIILTTGLIGLASTTAAHHEHAAAQNGTEILGLAVLTGMALISLPALTRALRK